MEKKDGKFCAGKEREKDVFRLVTSVEQRKNGKYAILLYWFRFRWSVKIVNKVVTETSFPCIPTSLKKWERKGGFLIGGGHLFDIMALVGGRQFGGGRLRECLCKSGPVDFAWGADFAHFLCVVRHSCIYTKTTIRLIGSLYFSEFYGN